MKLPFLLSAFAALVCFAPVVGQAQDLTPPYVSNGIPNRTVGRNATYSSIDLTDTFALSGGEGLVVRFDTTLGPIDVRLRDDYAPQTVQNFLYYAGNGLYNGSFIHRSVSGFIWQGGGYTFQDGDTQTIPAQAPVPNEFGLSNQRGTIAMAKLGGNPDSATSQWFFNLADNSANLDAQNGGFTVFGEVITNGLDVVDAVASLLTYNFGSPFDQIPLVDYDGSSAVEPENLVLLNGVYLVPVVPSAVGGPALLTLRVVKNSNPGVASARIAQGHRLRLDYTGAPGSTTISIRATNTAGSSVIAKVKITKN